MAYAITVQVEKMSGGRFGFTLSDRYRDRLMAELIADSIRLGDTVELVESDAPVNWSKVLSVAVKAGPVAPKRAA